MTKNYKSASKYALRTLNSVVLSKSFINYRGRKDLQFAWAGRRKANHHLRMRQVQLRGQVLWMFPLGWNMQRQVRLHRLQEQVRPETALSKSGVEWMQLCKKRLPEKILRVLSKRKKVWLILQLQRVSK